MVMRSLVLLLVCSSWVGLGCKQPGGEAHASTEAHAAGSSEAHGDASASAHGDASASAHGDASASAHGDASASTHGDASASTHGDASASTHGATSDKHDEHGAVAAADKESSDKHAHADGHGGHQDGGPPDSNLALGPMPIPFAKDGPNQDLAKAFLKAAMKDNAEFAMNTPAAHFAEIAGEQKPRATVLACADARVQAGAFHHAPENDLFTVRNIGNQFKTAAGSIRYGVEQLQTPVLLVLGHTGCEVVKAALGEHAKLESEIKQEVDQLHVPKPDPKTGGSKPSAKVNEDEVLTKAIAANVHEQVKVALGHFAERVREGKLVVIGAVYDLRNDLKHGQGKVIVVNVNGSTDPAVLASVLDAVQR